MFFDIGANIGKWSLSNVNNTSRIIAIEAVPETFNKLLESTYYNPKILCLNLAVCKSDNDYIDFYSCEAHTLSTLNKNWLDSESSRFYNYKYNTIKCKTISIDKLIELYGVPELIKIDVEGGEFDCVSSLTKKINNLCFEWASETNDITFKCLDYLSNIGFSQFSIQFEDDYLYRPSSYTDIDTVKKILNETIPKKDWGMIWSK